MNRCPESEGRSKRSLAGSRMVCARVALAWSGACQNIAADIDGDDNHRQQNTITMFGMFRPTNALSGGLLWYADN